MSGWISIEDKLPKEGTAVYVIGKDKECVHLSILKDGKWTLYQGSEVTHWTPMVSKIEWKQK